MHPNAGYWDRGVKNVPDMTGAKHLLDGRDLKTVFTALDLPVPFPGFVIDVGCGTGRLAKLCADPTNYWGLDISPSMVDYCRAEGLSADLMTEPRCHVMPDVALLTCISVFTHMDRPERQRYLASFHVMAPRVLVDIIPGDGSGSVALWTADPVEFVADVCVAGFNIAGDVTQKWDDHMHRYFLLERT